MITIKDECVEKITGYLNNLQGQIDEAIDAYQPRTGKIGQIKELFGRKQGALDVLKCAGIDAIRNDQGYILSQY